MTEQTTPAKTQAEFFKQMVDLYTQLEAFNDTIKAVKQEAKDQGYDAAMLGTVAKAVAVDKVAELLEKSQATAELIDELA